MSEKIFNETYLKCGICGSDVSEEVAKGIDYVTHFFKCRNCEDELIDLRDKLAEARTLYLKYATMYNDLQDNIKAILF